jgi:glycosyltransferase family protein
LILSLYIIWTYKYEIICSKCINKYKKDECLICRNNLIFKNIKIYDDEKTLDEIISKKKSISRFGDGEFKFSKEKNLLIGINVPYKPKIIDIFNPEARDYYTKWLKNFRFKLAKILKNHEYYSSTITRFYIDLKSKKGVPNYIKKLKKVWDQREVVIIEGEKSRLGVGNDLFDNMKSIERIICPTINAFNKYKEIINTIKKNVRKNKLILIALGPTATILAYDLYKLGYLAIDIGHIDIEYEWFLRKANTKIPIKNKYVNEIRKRKNKFTKVKDKNYYHQIIAQISR